MNRFKDNMRVIVDRPFGDERALLLNLRGTVVRLRRADDLAWVKMDSTLPDGFAVFPKGDPRAQDILMDPRECTKLIGPAQPVERTTCESSTTRTEAKS